jgi:hypothetical protein
VLDYRAGCACGCSAANKCSHVANVVAIALSLSMLCRAGQQREPGWRLWRRRRARRECQR